MMNICAKVRPPICFAMLLVVLLLCGTLSKAHASHFRYGSLSWKARPDVGTNTAELTLFNAFRRDGFIGSGSDGFPVTGDVIQEDIGHTNLSFGDGSSTGVLSYLVIAYDQSANYVYCKAIADPKNLGLPLLHTYSGPGPWIANIDSGGRISNSINSPNGNYRVQTNINFATTSASPVSTLPAVLNCNSGGVFSFSVPAASSSGDLLVWRLARPAEDGYLAQPAGFSVDAKGNVNWNTVGLTLGLYSCQIVIDAYDSKTGVYKTQIGVDFLLNLTQNQSVGNPPIFIQSAPTNGTQFDVATGKILTFEIKAQGDFGKTVTLNAIGLPNGASMLPALPTSGNPVTSAFQWTPSPLQTGPTVVVFTAKDSAGLETDCSIIINVLLDSDGDGLPDDWELHGFTFKGHFVNLPAMGANPYHKDIFVHFDYMVDRSGLFGLFGHSHQPNPNAISTIVRSFANAPVSNPDGATGINLHVNQDSPGKAIPETLVLGSLNGSDYDWTSFDALKRTYFPEECSLFEHYCIFAHQFGSSKTLNSGVARAIINQSQQFVGNDFIVSLGGSPTHVGTMLEQAGTFMHELGHTLGLQHGGGDSILYKPNYLSVMNYSFQFSGLNRNGADGLFDYSKFGPPQQSAPPSLFDLPSLNEDLLDEAAGLNGGGAVTTYGTTWFVPNTSGGYDQKFTNHANAPIDWNGDGGIGVGFLESADIHKSQSNDQPQKGIGILTSFNDWANLNYKGGVIGAGLILPQPMSTPASELDIATASTLKPFPPAGITGRAGVKAVRLAWIALGPTTEYTYKVYVIVGGSKQLLITTAAPLASFAGLKSGSAYSYCVTSINALGTESEPSAITVTPL